MNHFFRQAKCFANRLALQFPYQLYIGPQVSTIRSAERIDVITAVVSRNNEWKPIRFEKYQCRKATCDTAITVYKGVD